MIKAFVLAGLTFSTLLFPQLAHADWQLNNDSSQVSFVSIKKDSIGEVHHFKQLQGQLTDAGQLIIKIDLASAETLIPIRNERLSKILFQTEQFPYAVITANLAAQKVQLKQPGQHVIKQIPAELDFHGVKKTLQLDVLVSHTAKGDLTVASFAPVIINGDDFAVTAGIKQLQQLAGLPSIATAVPVTFALTFNNQ